LSPPPSAPPAKNAAAPTTTTTTTVTITARIAQRPPGYPADASWARALVTRARARSTDWRAAETPLELPESAAFEYLVHAVATAPSASASRSRAALASAPTGARRAARAALRTARAKAAAAGACVFAG